MTPAEQIVRAVLTMHAAPFYVAQTPYQQDRVVEAALKALTPILTQIIRQEAEQLSANPT